MCATTNSLILSKWPRPNRENDWILRELSDVTVVRCCLLTWRDTFECVLLEESWGLVWDWSTNPKMTYPLVLLHLLNIRLKNHLYTPFPYWVLLLSPRLVMTSGNSCNITTTHLQLLGFNMKQTQNFTASSALIDFRRVIQPSVVWWPQRTYEHEVLRHVNYR